MGGRERYGCEPEVPSREPKGIEIHVINPGSQVGGTETITDYRHSGRRSPQHRHDTYIGGIGMFTTLIVEDNVTFRQSLKELLRTRFPSMDVQEAGDGEEALRKIDALPPDIIFMDIKLPGENGLQVTKKVKTSYPQITVIILTYYDLPEHRDAAFQCGASHFLPKGTSTEEIVGLVQSVLSEKGLDSGCPDKEGL